jgi:hypothetical protein
MVGIEVHDPKGALTNKLIYRRIAPGLLKKLKERKSEGKLRSLDCR